MLQRTISRDCKGIQGWHHATIEVKKPETLNPKPQTKLHERFEAIGKTDPDLSSILWGTKGQPMGVY